MSAAAAALLAAAQLGAGEGDAPGAARALPAAAASGPGSAAGATPDRRRGASSPGGAAVGRAADARATHEARPLAVRDAEAEGLSRDERRAVAHPAIALDAPVALGSAIGVTGRDPLAPRALELWRIVGDRAAVVARGASRPDGTLDFPPLVLPSGEVALAASPRGAGPRAPGASAAAVASRDPSPPRLVSVEAADAGGALALRLEPAEASGRVLLAARVAPQPEAAVFAHFDVADAGEGLAAALEIEVALPPGATALRVAHELPDGRRSAWRGVATGSGCGPGCPVTGDQEVRDGRED